MEHTKARRRIGILAAMPQPLVHVLVINWNGLEHLEECFSTLLASPYANVRFVLLDNASTDGSVAFVKERFGADPRIEYMVLDKNHGWSGANNLGLERALAAGARYAFLLNNDTATAANALDALVEAIESQPDVGALAPKMLLHSEPALLNSAGLECSIIGNSWDRGLGRLDGPRWDEERDVIGVCGGACFLRMEAVEKAGLLPADFEIYLDDLDLCLRIWEAGYRIRTCSRAVVKHKFSATMGTGKRAHQKYYLNTRNRFRVVERNFPLRRLPETAAALVLGEARAAGRAALDGQWWRIAAHAKAWADAVGYLGKACQERGRRRKAGTANGRFWHLILRTPLFFPGAPLPHNGWYEERRIAGQRVRPISAAATLALGGRRVGISLVNAFPHLGAAEVEVWRDGAYVGMLTSETIPSGELADLTGVVELRARRYFYAEDTGERADYGGWIAIRDEGK